MTGRYLYCPHCGEYLGSLGADYCWLCDVRLVPDEDGEQQENGGERAR